jgi:hypothetical protein
MTTVRQAPAAAPDRDIEALIKEAQARQRRRHRRVAIALLLASAAGAGTFVAFGGGSANHLPPPAAASPGAIRAFLARANHALSGTFTVTYQVTVKAPARAGMPAWQAVVVAAQRSRVERFYRQTPSLSRLNGIRRSHSYEVAESRSGIFSCAQAGTAAPWSCQGPYTGIGMGTTWELLGPYIPQALYLGLQNAAEAYTGAPSHSASAATRPEPAYQFTRRLAGQTDRCLAFGPIGRPRGSVCLAPNGLITYYNLPTSVTYGTYQTATMRSYSARVNPGTFTLPAEPARPR